VARLHEYQGKALLAQHGIAVPRGSVATSPIEAERAAAEIGGRVILKVQAWVTGRRSKGGVVFADSPAEARAQAARLLGMTFGNFPVTEVLIEETIDIRDELFVSLSIDDAAQAPVMLLDLRGGTGIEERAASVARLPVDVKCGVDAAAVRGLLKDSPIDASLHDDLVRAITGVFEIAKEHEARSVEINPLVTTRDGRIVAADCRMTIDDYAVFRHPDLGIEIARELDHPATRLERIAYEVEKNDHRGTFYFAQLPTDVAHGHDGRATNLIGFHGAGGGGSMMSMDAVSNAGFTLANFCDTSGNPSAAKVYRAARIILAQPGLVGYFGSGSGVASQEQFWSAYGLAKAFIEMNLSIPAVIRLGGNSEDRAVEILEDACRALPGVVEGYKKDDTPQFCAERFAELVLTSRDRQGARGAEGEAGGTGVPPVRVSGGTGISPRRVACGDLPVSDGTGIPPAHGGASRRHIPAFVRAPGSYHFELSGGEGGTVWIDHEHCPSDTAAKVIDLSGGLLRLDERGKPVLAVTPDEIAKKDSELIALEIECRRAGHSIVFVDLPIPGLDEGSATAA